MVMLSDGRWHSNGELAQISPRYGGYLHTMKKLGQDFETRHVKGGLWEYRLIPLEEGNQGRLF